MDNKTTIYHASTLKVCTTYWFLLVSPVILFSAYFILDMPFLFLLLFAALSLPLLFTLLLFITSKVLITENEIIHKTLLGEQKIRRNNVISVEKIHRPSIISIIFKKPLSLKIISSDGTEIYFSHFLENFKKAEKEIETAIK
jgi:hypothetical protein